MATELVTFGEASEALGVSYDVVSTLVAVHGIEPKPFPYNGRAKGLGPEDMATLRRALKLREGEKLRRPRRSAVTR